MKLEKAFEKEFQGFHLKVSINNLYLRQNIPEIHLEFSLMAPFKIDLIIIVNHNFPKMEAPHVYSLSDIQHDLIDPRSKEIQFGSIYDWTKRPSLVNLIITLDRAFKASQSRLQGTRKSIEDKIGLLETKQLELSRHAQEIKRGNRIDTTLIESHVRDVALRL